MDFKEITEQSKKAAEEIIEAAHLGKGALFVIGCSSSEVLGSQIGTATNMDSAMTVLYRCLRNTGYMLQRNAASI